jgi:OOP family OmpA-OmpF porin
MASKKYALAIGLLCLAQGAVNAQDNTPRNDTQSYWDDSSKIATKNLPQYNEFRNNQYPYPANPRDKWQLGIQGGYVYPLFDVPNTGFNWAAGLSLRKSLGYVVSVKVGAQYLRSEGQEYRPGTNLNNLPASIAATYRANNLSVWVPNYKMQAILPSIEAIFSLKNILFHQGNPKSNVYLTVGYSPMVYKTKIDALDASGRPYNFGGVNFAQSRGDAKSAVKALMDGNYETSAQVRPRSPEFGTANAEGNGNWQLRHSGFVGAGYEFRLGAGTSLGLDVKYYLTGDDYLDGKYLQSGANVYTTGKDNFLVTSLTFGIDLGSSAKRTQPKWFINPLNFAYSELNNPKHMKIPPPVLPDADGDGVTDQFDREPNTPAGAPVDVHGVAKDTDGDGVPDYKDKELLTPNKCFPVDADGVGNCPEPPCCTELRNRLDSAIANGGIGKGDCGLPALPSVTFKANSVTLSADAKKILSQAASTINANPTCNVKVTGYVSETDASKRQQQLSYDRVNAVINYLVKSKGVSESRLIFAYGQTGGDVNTVDLVGTTEAGGNSVSAPFPQYKKTK